MWANTICNVRNKQPVDGAGQKRTAMQVLTIQAKMGAQLLQSSQRAANIQSRRRSGLMGDESCVGSARSATRLELRVGVLRREAAIVSKCGTGRLFGEANQR